MRLSEHSLKHAEAIIKHCTDNGMAAESSMGLWNHLVKVFKRLDVFDGRAPRPVESEPTDAQQANGKNYPKVELKHYPGLTCPKCAQFYSICRCG
jgi:hypothetical protein